MLRILICGSDRELSIALKGAITPSWVVCEENSARFHALINLSAERNEPYHAVILESTTETVEVESSVCRLCYRQPPPGTRVLHIVAPQHVAAIRRHAETLHPGPLPGWNSWIEKVGDWRERVITQIRSYDCNLAANDVMQAIFPALTPSLVRRGYSASTDIYRLRRIIHNCWNWLDGEKHQILTSTFPPSKDGVPRVLFHRPGTREQFETGLRVVEELVDLDDPVTTRHFLLFCRANDDIGPAPGKVDRDVMIEYQDALEHFVDFWEARGVPFPLSEGEHLRIYVAQSSLLRLGEGCSFADVDAEGSPYLLLPAFDGKVPRPVKAIWTIAWREMAHFYQLMGRPETECLSETWRWFHGKMANYVARVAADLWELPETEVETSPIARPVDETPGEDVLLLFDYLEAQSPGVLFRAWNGGHQDEHWIASIQRLEEPAEGLLPPYFGFGQDRLLDRFLAHPQMLGEDFVRRPRQINIAPGGEWSEDFAIRHLSCDSYEIVTGELADHVEIVLETTSKYLRPYVMAKYSGALSEQDEGPGVDFDGDSEICHYYLVRRDGQHWVHVPIDASCGLKAVCLRVVNWGHLGRKHHLDSCGHHDEERYTIRARIGKRTGSVTASE